MAILEPLYWETPLGHSDPYLAKIWPGVFLKMLLAMLLTMLLTMMLRPLIWEIPLDLSNPVQALEFILVLVYDFVP